jgi:hypothetical protein
MNKSLELCAVESMVAEAVTEDICMIYINIYIWYTLLTATKRTALYSFISAQQKMKTNPATKAGVIVNKA